MKINIYNIIMPICDHCKIKLDAQEPETEPEPEPEIKKRGRPCSVLDKVAQKKLYNSRYYIRCKERKALKNETEIKENNDNAIKQEP